MVQIFGMVAAARPDDILTMGVKKKRVRWQRRMASITVRHSMGFVTVGDRTIAVASNIRGSRSARGGMQALMYIHSAGRYLQRIHELTEGRPVISINGDHRLVHMYARRHQRTAVPIDASQSIGIIGADCPDHDA